jgi:hypothetical protein
MLPITYKTWFGQIAVVLITYKHLVWSDCNGPHYPLTVTLDGLELSPLLMSSCFGQIAEVPIAASNALQPTQIE